MNVHEYYRHQLNEFWYSYKIFFPGPYRRSRHDNDITYDNFCVKYIHNKIMLITFFLKVTEVSILHDFAILQQLEWYITFVFCFTRFLLTYYLQAVNKCAAELQRWSLYSLGCSSHKLCFLEVELTCAVTQWHTWPTCRTFLSVS